MNLAQIIGRARMATDHYGEIIVAPDLSLLGTRPLVGRLNASGVTDPKTRGYSFTNGCNYAVRELFIRNGMRSMETVEVVAALAQNYTQEQVWKALADSVSFARVERGVYRITKRGRELYRNEVERRKDE